MKKILKVVICLMVFISFTGCGLSNKNSEGNNNDTNKSEKPAVNKKTSEEKISEFVDQYRESVETFSNSIFDATLLARGKSIVYSYTYKTTYDKEDLETMKVALEKGIESSKNVFTDLLTTVRTVASDAESVIIEYYNGDKTLITSIEYK